MKVCRRCNIEKGDSCFGANRKNKDSLRSYCYGCANKLQEGYRRAKGILPHGSKPPKPIPDSKECTRCKQIKPKDDFRLKSDYRNKTTIRLNATCMKCDTEIATGYYERKKNDPDFRKKNCERVKLYARSNSDKIKKTRSSERFKKKHSEWESKRYYRKKDEIAAKLKFRRQTPEYKSMMKSYREKNRDKIRLQEIRTKKKYQSYHRDNVTDEYIIRQLVGQGMATREMLEQPENYQLIEAKRLQILIKRKIKQHGSNTD